MNYLVLVVVDALAAKGVVVYFQNGAPESCIYRVRCTTDVLHRLYNLTFIGQIKLLKLVLGMLENKMVQCSVEYEYIAVGGGGHLYVCCACIGNLFYLSKQTCMGYTVGLAVKQEQLARCIGHENICIIKSAH